MSIYLELTHAFNRGRLRAILSSGQAVVLHRLAIMSKDGDWILREEPEALEHILAELESRAARYRYGAPLDLRWMRGGWSAHFEFRHDALRVRADFVTRPARIAANRLHSMWSAAESQKAPVPFVGASDLVAIKKTDREKDYAVIGELARLIPDPAGQMLASRSARDLLALVRQRPDLLVELTPLRPVLAAAEEGRDALETALDAERRSLMRANERRLEAYRAAAGRWEAAWPGIAREIEGLPLRQAHAVVIARAEALLPTVPEADVP